MAYLLLDLDLTTFVVEGQEEDFGRAHTLSNPIIANVCYPQYNSLMPWAVRLINKDEISKLVESACTKHDGVIILTAGCWDVSVREVLAKNLTLSKEAAESLRNCRFHSAMTDASYFEGDLQTVRNMNKNLRLEKIIKNDPELASKQFVMLDDGEHHLYSFKGVEHVLPVLATTIDSDDKSFYDAAHKALEVAESREMNKVNKINLIVNEMKVPTVSKAREGFFSNPNNTIKVKIGAVSESRMLINITNAAVNKSNNMICNEKPSVKRPLSHQILLGPNNKRPAIDESRPDESAKRLKNG